MAQPIAPPRSPFGPLMIDRITGVHCRWAIRRDLPEILAIDSASDPAPWTEEDFRSHLARRDHIGMVAERGERVVGLMVYRLGRREIEVVRFAVAPDMRRRGVGRQMAARLAGKLSHQRRTALTWPVRESQLAGHLFLHSIGLTAVDVLRGHYDDTGEDAYLFRYELGESGHAG